MKIDFEAERLSEFTLNDFNDILSVQAEMSGKKGSSDFYSWKSRIFTLSIPHQ